MSDANLTSLFYAAETAFAETPDNYSALQELRFTSESLAHAKNTAISEEIRSDRARADLVQVGVTGEGSIDTELIIGAYDDFLLASLMASAWTQGQDSVTATSAAAGQTITATVGTFSAATQLAKYVKVAGFVNSGNNGIFRVVSCNSTVLTLAAGSLTGGDEVGVSITVDHNYARNGTTLTSYLIEKYFASLGTPHYVAMIGAVINSLDVSLEAQAIATQSFGIMGAKLLEDTSTFGDGSPTSASTRPIVNTTGDVNGLIWGGSAIGVNVMSFDMSLNNNLRERPAISRLYTLEHGKGSIDLTGNLQTYFENTTALQAFLEHTEIDLLIPLEDSGGNVMSIHLPAIKFSGGSPMAEGVNTDVMINLEYQAILDAALGYMIQIDRLDA